MDQFNKLLQDPRSAFIISKLNDLLNEHGEEFSTEEEKKKRITLIYLKFLERIGELADTGELARLGYRPMVDRQGNKILREEDLDELLVNFYRDHYGR